MSEVVLRDAVAADAEALAEMVVDLNLGLGWRLLSAAAERTRRWGGEVMWWITTQDNEVGKSFYRRVAEDVAGIEVWVAAGERFDALLAGSEGA